MAEKPGDQSRGFVWIDVAENGHDHIVGNEVLGVIFPQIFGREALDRFGFAVQQYVIRRFGGQVVVEKFGDLRLGTIVPAGDCA